MVSTDPISDMLTRIRNAIAVSKTEVSMPYSKIKQSVAELLKSSNFIDNVTVDGEGITKSLIITINNGSSNARITEIERLSRPGRRSYASADDIPVVKRGRGIVIISTSKGLMTGDEAKKTRIGGELICKVY
jgi:small subunit ribosomal protein S8